ncbi:MAG: hypothetical protein IT455_00385 [Planctomycetes bacterium]|nr:hypothetical protein [Planctomycetota bacterium]
MPASPPFPFALGAVMLLAAASAQTPPPPATTPAAPQQPSAVAYPERDILSPFRNPTDVYAPPDELFRLLRTMQAASERFPDRRSYDEQGREVVDDPAWREAMAGLQEQRLDPGYLAQVMRLHRNSTDRATAFYAMFWADDVDHVFNLISHIPGEPVRRTREAALPRAVEYLRRHLGRRFGDLTTEQKQAALAAMPQPGSPMAKAQGVSRQPTDADHLHTLRMTPFFQLLDVDDALDQAQGLWFLKEVFTLRRDLAELWLEPALPRLRQLLRVADERVRTQAIALLQGLAPEDLAPVAADADAAALERWAILVGKSMFPPIRNLNDAIVQLYDSPERDAIAAAGVRWLENGSIGGASDGQRKDGTRFYGCRVELLPEELKPLRIPLHAVITTVNGVPVRDAAAILATIKNQLEAQRKASPKRLFLEFVRDGVDHAIEYRVM